MDTHRPLRLSLAGRIRPEDVAAFCARLEAAEPGDVDCAIDALTHTDLAVVDALARIRLAATRSGHRIRFLGAPPDLLLLLALVGLDDLLR